MSTVKDLVQQYERSTSLSIPSPVSQGRTQSPEAVDTLSSIGYSDILRPRPARFLNHAAPVIFNGGSAQQATSKPDSVPSHTSSRTIPQSKPSTLSTTTLKIRDDQVEKSISSPPQSTESSKLSTRQVSRQAFFDSSATLIPTTDFDSKIGDSLYTYPPRTRDTNGNNTQNAGFDPTSEQHYKKRRHHPAHKPVPIIKVFSRRAPPLSLPKLDRYISALPAPFFRDDEDEKPSEQMFPPMDALGKTGRSLEDLENNSTVTPVWRNSSSIFASSTNFIIGFLVGLHRLLFYISLRFF